MNQITITKPDDWHLHLRDGDFLCETVAATERCFNRAIVMPNLVPPITNTEMALQYRSRILNASKQSSFQPLMTLYLTDSLNVNEIEVAHKAGIRAAKLYPAGATTNSSAAVSSIDSLKPIFEKMSEVGMLLLIHGEVTDAHVDIFDREKRFIDQFMISIRKQFPSLKIVFEHITTSDAVDFVRGEGSNIAATITPQHLLLNRNDMLVGGIRPHNYCLPVLKRNTHQHALQEAATSGITKFFLGTDSAPHTKSTKEAACGCAGCYSAWGAIELYAQIFDDLGCLDKLEGFASFFGADFYGLPRNSETITLVKERWQMPNEITFANGESLVPFYADQPLNWKLAPTL